MICLYKKLVTTDMLMGYSTPDVLRSCLVFDGYWNYHYKAEYSM